MYLLIAKIGLSKIFQWVGHILVDIFYYSDKENRLEQSGF